MFLSSSQCPNVKCSRWQRNQNFLKYRFRWCGKANMMFSIVIVNSSTEFYAYSMRSMQTVFVQKLKHRNSPSRKHNNEHTERDGIIYAWLKYNRNCQIHCWINALKLLNYSCLECHKEKKHRLYLEPFAFHNWMNFNNRNEYGCNNTAIWKLIYFVWH